jgi:dihydropyrimidinase
VSDHDLVIRGGRVIGADGERMADVAVDGELIAAVAPGLRGRREIDADGLYVIPGAVDGHVHMRTDRPLHAAAVATSGTAGLRRRYDHHRPGSGGSRARR